MSALVIIGTGLAGYNLAKEYRKLDSERELILISADGGESYSKPLLSTAVAKQKTAPQLAMADAETMAAQLNAKVLTRQRVRDIDPTTCTLQLDGCAEPLAYGQLVLALGAEVIRPPLAGDALDQVLSINDLDDYARFRDALAGKRRVLIIGAGLIGCEFANDLRSGDIEVEVVDPAGRCLPGLLPEAASQAVQFGLESIGVRFRFGPLVQAVNRTEQGLAVSLSDGTCIDTDLVISAVGLRPRLELARQAGLATGRGILVDNCLRTTDPNIYALGDCAEVSGLVLLYVLPLMAGARTLARTLAGDLTPVSYPAMPVTVKTPACPVIVAPPMKASEGVWQVEQEGQDVRAECRDPSGTLLGFALTGARANPREKTELSKCLGAWLA